jgi:hypothetical protein
VQLERRDRLVAPEAGVGADEQRAARPETAHPLYELAHESLCAALALSGALAHTRMQQLTGVSAGRRDRVVATPLRVAEARALLGAPGDLDDCGVEVDRERLRARPRPCCPGSSKEQLEGAVEPAHAPERERAQERPQRRGRDHAVAKHTLRLAAAEDARLVDRVAADERRADERQQHAAGPSRPRPLTKLERLVHDSLDPEPLGERTRQNKARVRDRALVVEGECEPVDPAPTTPIRALRSRHHTDDLLSAGLAAAL